MRSLLSISTPAQLQVLLRPAAARRCCTAEVAQVRSQLHTADSRRVPLPDAVGINGKMPVAESFPAPQTRPAFQVNVQEVSEGSWASASQPDSPVLIRRWRAPSLLLAQLKNATKHREMSLLRNLHIHLGKKRCWNPLSQIKEVATHYVAYNGGVFLVVNKFHLRVSAQVTFPSINALLLCCTNRAATISRSNRLRRHAHLFLQCCTGC